MQCDDCREIYRADSAKQPCPKCGGKGTVLVDITQQYYPNRAARRAAHKERIMKLLPCPDCKELYMSSLYGRHGLKEKPVIRR